MPTESDDLRLLVRPGEPSELPWMDVPDAQPEKQGRLMDPPLRYKELKITTMDSKIVSLGENLLPVQVRILEEIKLRRWQIRAGKRRWGRVRLTILKARKEGCSTVIQAMIFKSAVMRPLSEALIISHKDDSSRYLYGISERFHQWLDAVRQPVRRFHTKRGLTFAPPIDSSIQVETVGEGAARSKTIHQFHASEVALWGDDASETMLAVRNAMASEPWCTEIMESTGYGLGGYFHGAYMKAKEEGDALFFPWWIDPRYSRKPAIEPRDAFEEEQVKLYHLTGEQLAFLRWKLQEDCDGDTEKFRQEFPGCEQDAFRGKALYVFGPDLIEYVDSCIKKAAAVPEWRMEKGMPHGENMTLLGTLERLSYGSGPPDSAYVIGADPATGKEDGDYSAAVVIDRVSRHVVACLRCHLDPQQFAAALLELGRYYNRAWLAVERNNEGFGVIGALRDSGYPHLWAERQPWVKKLKIVPQFGFATTEGSKQVAIVCAQKALRQQRLFIPFRSIRDEMVNFITKDGRSGAVSGTHDDLTMALLVGNVVAEDLGSRDPVAADRERMAQVDLDVYGWQRPIQQRDMDFLRRDQLGLERNLAKKE